MPPITELPGSLAGRFRLVQRLGGARSSAWRGEDPDRQKPVVVRVLTRSLPPDPARRAALLERVRQRAAFHHPAFPEIDSIWIEGDALLLCEELVEGTSLSRMNRPLEPAAVLKLAWQLADALRALHARRIIHGALQPDHVIATADGFRLTGLSLAALTARDDRGEERLLHSADASDLHELSYRSPEQISARGTEARSDVFSLGALLYDAATGLAPFTGANATEIANQVLRGSPRSPLEINPRLPIGVIAVIGKCLMKDSVKRFQDMPQLQEELRRIDPKIESTAARAVQPAARRKETARTSETPFILGILPYFDLLERKDAEKAGRLAARMQQGLGEAVLLADGTILDSLGARFVATVPSPDAALAALRRAALQITEQNAAAPDGEILEATVLAHAGALTIEPTPSGPAFDLAERIVASMEPGQMLMTASVATAAGVAGGAAPLGAAEGVGLCAVPPEEVPEAPPVAESVSEQAVDARPPQKPRRAIAFIAAAAALFLVAIAAIVFWPREKDAAPIATAPASSSAPADSRPQLILEPFSVDGTDPEIVARAAALEEAVRAMLATSPDLRLLDQPASGAARRYGTRAVPGGTKDQFTVYSIAGGPGETGPLSLTDPTAASAIAAWIAQSAGTAPGRIASSNPDALAAFVDSLVEKRSGTPERAATAIRRALAADPDFLPVARAAVPILTTAGDRTGAIAAAENLVRLDPEDRATRRLLVAWFREGGNAPRAISHAGPLLASADADPELLVFVARAALSAGDFDTFQRVLTRLQRTGPRGKLSLHAADATAARGQLGVAVQQYYELEPSERQNPFLSLKIARIDVLRHSIPAAELELEKLRLLDASYGAELLGAYLAAEQRDARGAAAALARAAASPNRGADFHTAEAEVYAILSDHRGLLSALGRAVETKEPTFAYILANPLFAYLRDEEEFAPLRAAMETSQQQLRTALAAAR